MKNKHLHNRRHFAHAFTFWELLGVIAVISILTSLLFAYATHSKRTGHPILCSNNLRHIRIAALMFASDNDQHFPFTSTNSPAYQNSAETWLHFYSLSNELGNPRVLICPQDTERKATTASVFTTGTNSTHAALSTFGNRAVSYFVNLDAKETAPDAVFIGDRNVYASGIRPTNTLLTLAGTAQLFWTASQHTNIGNVVFSDGHVESGIKTTPAWSHRPETIRLLLPY